MFSALTGQDVILPFEHGRKELRLIAKDRGANIEAVSKALRHKTTRTTELYYARIRAEDAFTELESVFSDCDAPSGCPVPKGAD